MYSHDRCCKTIPKFGDRIDWDIKEIMVLKVLSYHLILALWSIPSILQTKILVLLSSLKIRLIPILRVLLSKESSFSDWFWDLSSEKLCISNMKVFRINKKVQHEIFSLIPIHLHKKFMLQTSKKTETIKVNFIIGVYEMKALYL